MPSVSPYLAINFARRTRSFGLVEKMAHQVTADTQELVGILDKMVSLEHLDTQDIVDQESAGIVDIRAFLDTAELTANQGILAYQVLVVTQVLMAHLDTQESAVTAVLA